MKHNRIILALSLIGLAVLILMLNYTAPMEIGPLGVLLFFTTFFVVVFGAFVYLLKLFFWLAFGRKEWRKKDYAYAVVAAFGVMMLMMVRAFGVLSWWTGGLVIFCVGMVEFLVYKKFNM